VFPLLGCPDDLYIRFAEEKIKHVNCSRNGWNSGISSKAARVTLVGYEKIGTGRVTVIVRGDVSEVQASVAAGVESANKVNGGQVLSTHIIARPHENLEYVLPIRYTEEVEPFRSY